MYGDTKSFFGENFILKWNVFRACIIEFRDTRTSIWIEFTSPFKSIIKCLNKESRNFVLTTNQNQTIVPSLFSLSFEFSLLIYWILLMGLLRMSMCGPTIKHLDIFQYWARKPSRFSKFILISISLSRYSDPLSCIDTSS